MIPAPASRTGKLFLIAVGVAGLAGGVIAGLDLYRATRTVQSVYTAGITGLSLYSDLTFATEESRRQFLYALAVSDPNLQLPHIDRARAVDEEVNRVMARLADLPAAAGVRTSCRKFTGRWKAYLTVRDEVIALILEGRPVEAVAVMTDKGDTTFRAASQEMLRIRHDLDNYGRAQTVAIRLTFYRAGIELVLLFASVVLFIALLVRMLSVLRRSHQAIAAAKLTEQARNRVLEMVGRNEPLETVLDSVVQYLERQYPGARAVLSLVEGDQLRLTAAPGFPAEIHSVVESLPPDLAEMRQGEAPGESGWTPHSDLALRHGLTCCWWNPITSSDNGVIGIVAIFHPAGTAAGDVDRETLAGATRLAGVAIEHNVLYHRLAHQALHDPLTALPNRLLFQDRLQQAIGRAERNAKRAAVLWIDLDHFKTVNDTLGHRAGDTVLRQVAQRLSGSLRKSDTVARIGGDEFTVILGDMEDSAAAEHLAAIMLESLRVPVALPDRSVTVTASIGISLYPNHGQDSSTLVRNADIAMYEAKKGGKNAFCMYASEMGQIVQEQNDISLQLASALGNAEFELHYQPQLTLDGVIVGFEALIRWTNPVLGSVSPAQFIPIAEETGQIIAIGDWALNHACAQNASWQRAGLKPVRVAVNISAVQLLRPEFIQSVAGALITANLDARYLELELTETAVMRDIDLAAKQIGRLRTLGVSVSIDDFGTGYSSLSYINNLPVNSVKIDQSFVRQMDEASGGTSSLVRTIVSMAHDMNLQVVAEGIETEAQLRALRSTGCDLGQGFLMYRPLRADAARDLLEPVQCPRELLHRIEQPELAHAS